MVFFFTARSPLLPTHNSLARLVEILTTFSAFSSKESTALDESWTESLKLPHVPL